MTERRWHVAPPPPAEFSTRFPKLSVVLRQLLYQRGLHTQAAIDQFLHPDYDQDLHDPFSLAGMAQAVERITGALQGQERILVYGDYDADGVCAAALVVSALQALGAQPGVYLPFREAEGYGLNSSAVAEITQQGYRLVVTVDCGISNVAEVSQLEVAGVDVIIVDHHTPQEILPPAHTVLNPKLPAAGYPYLHLSAAGLAFKLIQAMLADATRQRHASVRYPPRGFEKWLLDLVAISTVADLCELLGENRTLVHYGLAVLRKTKRVGLRALVAAAGLTLEQLNTQAIGFALAPRLNAAGRMNHASTAYRLLVSEDADEGARLAAELDEQNRQRQQRTETIRSSARQQVNGALGRPLVFASSPDWHVGLVGLVAGRLADEYHKPAVVIGRTPDGGLVGSGRSVPGFNITAALAECREYLSRYGGHAAACGFTVRRGEDIEPFRRRLEELAVAALGSTPAPPRLEVDAEVDLAEVTLEFGQQLKQLEPYGMGNPRPRFVSRGLQVSAVQPVGANGQHLRLMVSQHGHPDVVKLIGFSLTDKVPTLAAGDLLDIVYEVDITRWNGRFELQLKIVDLRQMDAGARSQPR